MFDNKDVYDTIIIICMCLIVIGSLYSYNAKAKPMCVETYGLCKNV